MKKTLLLFVIISIVGISLFASSLDFQSLQTQLSIPTKTTTQTTVPAGVASSRIVTISAPAVDIEGNGIIANLIVEAGPGTGRVLVDINNLFFFIDIQNSIRAAQRVAQNFTRVNISNFDLVYTVSADAEVIEGPSAGAAFTIATIAALEGKKLNSSVSITGTIEPDGTIGEVGGIEAKAKAAKESGASVFLVPSGQGTATNYKPIQKCEKIGPITYCTTDYKPEEIDIESSSGIEIVEVKNIGEALNYFFS